MWPLIIEAAIWVGLYIINRITDQPPRNQSTLNELNLPRTETGSAVPLIFGKVRIDSPILAWIGPVVQHFDTVRNNAWFGADMLFVLGIPMPYSANAAYRPQFWNMWIDDHNLGVQGSFLYRNIYLPNLAPIPPPLLGGQWTSVSFQVDDLDIGGAVAFYDGQFQSGFLSFDGTGDLTLNPQDLSHANNGTRLMTRIGTSLDAAGVNFAARASYRSYLSVALTSQRLDAAQQWVLGAVGQLPAVSFEVSSYGDFTSNLSGGPIADDANPADVLYVILTSKWAELGWNALNVNLASFQQAAGTLQGEANGYSRAINTKTPALDVISDILRQIDGTLYLEPSTGQLVLKLIRGGYNQANPGGSSYPVFSDANENIIELSDYQLGAWRDTFNRVEVRYTSRAMDYKIDTALADDMANQVGQDGRLRLLSVEFLGCCTSANAHNLAARTLATVAVPLTKVTIVTNRDGVNVRPGDPIRITFSEFGIDGIFRVATCDFGQLFDNKITFTAVRDSFDNGSQAWTQLGSGPQVLLPPTIVYTSEAPYFQMRQMANFGAINSADVQRTWSLAAKSGTGQAYGSASTLYKAAGGAGPLYKPITIDDNWNPDDSKYGLNTTRTAFSWYGTVETAVARETEPYMTQSTIRITLVSGTPDPDLVIQSVVTTYVTVGGITFPVRQFVISPDTVGQAFAIAQQGKFLLVIGTEIVGYEFRTVDPINPNVIILHNVWRGLQDTPASSHAVGTRVYNIETGNPLGHNLDTTHASPVGRTGFNVGDIVDTRVIPIIPNNGFTVDLGNESNNAIFTIRGRGAKPYAPANMLISGHYCIGAQGEPAQSQVPNGTTIAGALMLKRVDDFDEGLEVVASKRERTLNTITRGDAASETLASTTVTYSLFCGVTSSNVNDPINRSTTFLDVSSPIATSLATPASFAVGLGVVGHGPLFIGMSSRDAPTATSAAKSSWSFPVTRVNAKRWRNLVVNPRGNYNQTGWTATSGTPWTRVTGVGALSKISTDQYFSLTGSASGTMTTRIDLLGYLGDGQTIDGSYSYMNNSANSDVYTLTLNYFDANANFISTSGGFPTTAGTQPSYIKAPFSSTLPAGTRYVDVVIFWSPSNGLGQLSDFIIRVGQRTVLLAECFDASSGWTNLVYDTTASHQYLTINTAGTKQVGTVTAGVDAVSNAYTIPDGYQYGTVVLNYAQSFTGIGGAGVTTLEILDVSAVVIASVTSGPSSSSGALLWARKELSIDLPDGAVSVRIRLQCALVSNNALWDDLDLRIWKDSLRIPTTGFNAGFWQPAIVTNGLFSGGPPYNIPQTWQQYWQMHSLHPTPIMTFGLGQTGLLESTDQYDHFFSWSDGLAHTTGTITLFDGQANLDLTLKGSTSCYHFTRTTITTGVDVLVTTAPTYAGIDTLANFSRTTSFSCSVLFRTDEIVWAGPCGLVGRRGSAAGWSLEIDSTGHLIAALISPDGSQTVTRTNSVVNDGALHLAVIVYNATLKTLRVYDERGFNEVSTVGIGEFTISNTPFRLGRARLLTDMIPGDILSCTINGDALTQAQVGELWSYGKDPSGQVTTYSRPTAAWASSPPDANGATMTKWAADQVAIVYDPQLGAAWAGGYGGGIAVQPPDVNYAYTFDTTFAPRWIPEGLVNFTQGIVDPTGSPRGLRVSVNDVTAGGLLIQGAAMGLGQCVTFVFWARLNNGGPQLTCSLYSAGFPNLFGTQVVTLTSTWQRFVVSFTGVTGLPNALQVRMRLNNTDNGAVIGTPLASWEIGHVYWLGQSATAPVVPYLIPDPGVGSQTLIQMNATQQLHLNDDGELIASGIMPTSSTDVPASGAEPGTSAALMTLAMSNAGVLSAGWLCNEASGNLSAAFGGTTLTASGTPTYANPGPLGSNDKAIRFTANGDQFAAAGTYDVSATDDLLIVYTGMWSTAPSNFGAIIQKTSAAFGNGYAVTGGDGTGYYGFFAGPSAAVNSTLTNNYYVGRWHVGVAAIDRTNGLMQFGIMMLDTGEQFIAPLANGGSIASLGTLTNAGSFALGFGGWVGAQIGFNLANAYVGQGSAIAKAIPNNLPNILANVARNLYGSQILRAETPGDSRNLRRLVQGFGGALVGDHVDGANNGTRASASAPTWSNPFVARHRWQRVGLAETAAAGKAAGVIASDPINQVYGASNYNASALWTRGGTAVTSVKIGASCMPMLVSQAILSSGTPKIAPAFYDLV